MTWQVVLDDSASGIELRQRFPLAVAPSSAAIDIDYAIRDLIGCGEQFVQYRLADGTPVVLSGALPNGTELHCNLLNQTAQTSSAAPASPEHRTNSFVRARRTPVTDGILRLRVQTLTGKTIGVLAQPDDSIGDLQRKVQDKQGTNMRWAELWASMPWFTVPTHAHEHNLFHARYGKLSNMHMQHAFAHPALASWGCNAVHCVACARTLS